MIDEQFQHINQMDDVYFWYKARREIIKNVLDRYQLLNGKLDALEIGSANGKNIEYFGAYFNNIKGSEINLEAINIAKTKLPNHQFVNGWLPYNIGYDDEKFDVVFLFDVLEHVEDDLSALIEIKKKLKVNGKLLITVPAYQFLFGQYDIESYHYRRYNVKNLSEILLKAGYHVQYKSYFNCFLFPLVLITRLFEKVSRKTSGLTGGEYKDGLLNKILYKIMSSEKNILGKARLPFGSSIILVAENI